jgi:hypothetical protein
LLSLSPHNDDAYLEKQNLSQEADLRRNVFSNPDGVGSHLRIEIHFLKLFEIFSKIPGTCDHPLEVFLPARQVSLFLAHLS